MKLRLFVTICTRNFSTDKYQKESIELDYPPDVNLEAAYEETWAKYGKRGRDDKWSDIKKAMIAPPRYALITGHTFINENRPKATVGVEEKAIPQDLLTPMMLKESLMDSPNMSAKRRNRRRSVRE